MARILFYIVVLTIISACCSIGGVPIQSKMENKSPGDDSKKSEDADNQKIPEIIKHVNNAKETSKVEKGPEKGVPVQEIIIKPDLPTAKLNTSAKQLPAGKVDDDFLKDNAKNGGEMEQGALMRGVYVFVAISMLFMIYLGFKTYRKRNRAAVKVRKYGVRARHTDVEMEPLPLDDDEDETVFDLGNVGGR